MGRGGPAEGNEDAAGVGRPFLPVLPDNRCHCRRQRIRCVFSGAAATRGGLHWKFMAVNLGLRERRWLRLLWVVSTLLVIVGSLLPVSSAPMRALGQLQISDKLMHLAAYLVLAFLPALHERRPALVAAFVGAIALGISLEFAQRLSPGRAFEIADMTADGAGVLCGLVLALPLRYRIAPLNWK
jgi:VanZ family protein